MKSFIPWVGGKGKLLWLIHRLSPLRYSRFIDVFGGSGTVTLSRPIQRGCMEVYNDFNSDLTNLFCCVKNRTMALLRELGFLPLNSRDDFNVLYKFFSKEEFTDDYLKEELELTEVYLEPPEAEAIKRLMLERAPRGDVRRAADYYKLIRYSFSGGAKSFGGKVCDIRRFFHLIWECSRRLAEVIVENKDCVDLIRQYDRGDAFFYCDPPYFEAEGCYAVEFPKEDHQRLHDALLIQPHQNRGVIKSRDTEIRMEIQSVLGKGNAEGIRTEAQKRQLADAWLDLAVSCAKIPVKYEADLLKQQQKQEQAELLEECSEQQTPSEMPMAQQMM